MAPKTRALLFCLVLLAAAELGVRALERIRPSTGTLGITDRLAVLIGTSRTRYGIDPLLAEQVLNEQGVNDVFVGNACREAATNVGLLAVWNNRVKPFVLGHGRGLVAIEMRIEGFNDNYLAEGEDLPTGYQELRIEQPTLGERLAGGDLDKTSWWLLSRLRLASLPSLIRRLHEQYGGRQPEPANPGNESKDPRDKSGDAARETGRTRGDQRDKASDANANLPGWARGARGHKDLRKASEAYELQKVTQHYRDKVLADFEFGGIQTRVLEALVRSIRETGMEPLLYLMPVTPDHHAIYPGDLWARVLAHIHERAAALRVPFIDLDRDNRLSPDLYSDSSHLKGEGVTIVTTRLAEQALLPVLTR